MNEDKLQEFRERLSALADGELGGDEVSQLMAVPAVDEDMQGTWHAYHLIGDVLRGGEQAVRPGASGFLSRVQSRLQAEAPLVPLRPMVQAEPVAAVVDTVAASEPANDASFRWKMVAGCASFAAVVAMAWTVVGGAGPDAANPQVAAGPAPAQQSVVSTVAQAAPQTIEQRIELPDGGSQVMIRDPRLDELLTAHKQAGGGTALQMPAGFLRSATFSTPER
ncbi:hypothetical protein ASF43_15955 [Pseudorhodoferax sp. Leaf267]|nr:hypothetical protein ASF43_15955 [Pseudorhodoferax sp. Leaf267]